MDMANGRPLQIALCIDTATTWGSGLIEGIVEYSQQHEDWTFHVQQRGKYDPMVLPKGRRLDGVIARITTAELADEITQLGLPAVNVSWYRFGEGRIPRCICDEVATASVAANYFLERGFRQFAYCGAPLRPNYVDRFGDAFAAALIKVGFPCFRFAPPSASFAQLTWEEQRHELTEWLISLPRPVALLAFDAWQGWQVTEACEMAHIRVPYDVAVLGGDIDQLCCRISRPQLSGIDQAPQQVGYHAAALLAKQLRGERIENDVLALPPGRVVTRQSTDTVAVRDELLADALKFIKHNWAEPIRVGDILRVVPISRRALEKAFRKHLGRSPAEEIRRVRVEHATQLLCDTAWPMPKVAAACGFEHPELLTRAFRRELKTTPSQFRKRFARQA